MVANHAHKKLARALIAESNGRLSYLEAMGYAQRIPALYPKGHPGESISGRIKTVTLTRLPDGEIIGKTSDLEEGITSLRFATETMWKRMDSGDAGYHGLLVEIEMETDQSKNFGQLNLSKLEKSARLWIDSLNYLGPQWGVYLSVTPQNALIPIVREEQESMALELMRDKAGYSYEESLAEATRLLALRPTIQSEWKSKLHDPAVLQAKEALQSGRDLVIYGYASRGKSTACYAVLGALESRSLLVESSSFDLGFVREYLRGLPVSIVANETSTEPSDLDLDGVNFLALDEPNFSSSPGSSYPSLRKIITVHAGTSDDASRRLAILAPELKLVDPIFLAACGEPDENGSFTRWLEITN